MSSKTSHEELEQRIKNLEKEISDRDLFIGEFERIFNNSLDLIGSGNLEGYFTKINSSFERLLGYSEEEFIAKPFINFVCDEDQAKTKDALVAAANGTREIHIENRYKCKDGSLKWIDWKVQVRVQENQFIAVGRDITEKKTADENLRIAEKKFKDFIMSAEEGFVLYDSDLNLIDINDKALEIFPLGSSKEKFLGKNILEVAPYLKGTKRYEEYVEVKNSGKSLHFDDMVPDPIYGDRHLSLKAFKFSDGLGFIFTDITRRIKAEEEKSILESQLRQAHKMEAIGTMAGGIAHDFNNILAAILGYAELAKYDIPDFSPAKDQIEQVLKAGHRAKDLVRHILSFSRMSDMGQNHMQIDLIPIVKEVLKFQRSIIPTTIEIKSDIDENCDQIKGDPTEIHQVLMNLCTNSAHAMEDQGGTLEVSLHKTEANLYPGNYIQLSVRDTGPGLTPKLIDKMFDPYFTTKEVGKGSGMGLAVVHGIVKNHGGFIQIESEPGKGCTFNVFFPGIEEAIISEDRDETEEMPTGTERILFIDDEAMLTDIGKSMLEMLGYSVTTKTDSSEALDLFQSDPARFDLVITDQTMPNMTGSELAKQLLQIRSDIPIILCTGYSSMIDEVKAQKIGFKEYIMKPVDINVIARLIRKVLDEDEL